MTSSELCTFVHGSIASRNQTWNDADEECTNISLHGKETIQLCFRRQAEAFLPDAVLGTAVDQVRNQASTDYYLINVNHNRVTYVLFVTPTAGIETWTALPTGSSTPAGPSMSSVRSSVSGAGDQVRPSELDSTPSSTPEKGASFGPLKDHPKLPESWFPARIGVTV